MSPKRLALLISFIFAGVVCLSLLRSDPPPTKTTPRSQGQPDRQSLRAPPTTPREISATPPLVAGAVRDAYTGESLADAEVRLFAEAGLSPRVTLATAKTDAQGRFAFRLKDPTVSAKGYLSLHAAAGGYVPYDRDKPLLAGGNENNVVLRLTPGVRVEGTVYLPSGAAAEFGSIHLLDVVEPGRFDLLNGVRVQAAAKIQEDGRFVTFVRGPHFALQATVPGYAAGFTDIVSTESALPIEIRMNPGTALSGKVSDSAGNAIAGADVTAFVRPARDDPDRRFGYYHGEWRTQTNVSGDFTISDLPRGARLSIFCTHRDYRNLRTFDVTPGQFVDLCMLGGKVLRASFVRSDESKFFPTQVTLHTPEGESVHFRRSGDSYESECFRADSAAGRLRVRGFLSQLVTWPPGPELYDLGTITLEAGPHLQVCLVNLKGQPVQGSVHAFPAESNGAPSNLVFTLTQANPYPTNGVGVAMIGGLFDVPYEIFASSPGYSVHSMRAVPSVGGTEVVVTLQEADSWWVRIADDNGSPISGAKVELRDRESGFFVVSRAGTDGVALFQEVPLQVDLEAVVRAPGFSSHSVSVTPSQRGKGGTGSEIRLIRGVDLSLHVTSESREPVSGALVSLEQGEAAFDETPEASVESLTDREGHAVLRGLTPGRYRLAVSLTDHAPFEDVVDVTYGAVPIHVRLVRPPQLSVSGRLTYEDGSEVPDAKVSLEPGEYPYGFSDRVSARVLSDGSFTLPLRKPFNGPVSLSVRWGSQEKVVMAPSVDDLPKEIVVPRGADLIVYLVDGEQRPFLGKARLEVTNAKQDTDVSDSYRPKSGTLRVEFKGLPAGRSRLSATTAGYRIKGSPWEAVLDTDTLREVTLTALPTASPRPFSTRVFDEFGRPVLGAVVEVTPAEGDLAEGLFTSLYDSVWCRTDSRGVAEWLGFPDVEYTVSVSKRGFQEFERQSLPASQRTVTLKASATLWVKVNDELGVPVQDVRIHIHSLTDDGEREVAGPVDDFLDELVARFLPKRSQEPGSNPRYHYQLEPGRHRLRVRTEECFDHLEVVRLAPEESLRVEVVLPAVFEVSGRVVSGTQPLSRARIRVTSLDPMHPGVAILQTDQQGNFTARFRRSGNYSFRLLDPEGESAAKRIEVRPRGYVTLDFE